MTDGERAPGGAWRGPRPSTVQVYKEGAGERPGHGKGDGKGGGKGRGGFDGPGPFPWPRSL